jgi:DNA-binding response OmpR family regulator
MRILVVDDEPHLRRMMRLALEGAGYDVEEAADGEQALSMFGDGSRFAATLLDQRMPGLDGLEVLSRLKQRRADACVVMVTAYATIELAVEAMKLGATDFVRKPMTPETLRRAVAAALARSSAPADAGVSAEAAVAASDRPTTMPPIEIWTTNGFFVRRLGVTEEAGGLSHRFLVRQGRGESGVEIDVLIPARTRADTARQAGCQPSAEFWRRQAESALLNHLWAHAAVPHGSLVVGRVTGALVHAAMDASRV